MYRELWTFMVTSPWTPPNVRVTDLLLQLDYKNRRIFEKLSHPSNCPWFLNIREMSKKSK